ncbi:MAG: hypothetical protein ACRC41_09605 [Sarcina sp.]
MRNKFLTLIVIIILMSGALISCTNKDVDDKLQASTINEFDLKADDKDLDNENIENSIQKTIDDKNSETKIEEIKFDESLNNYYDENKKYLLSKDNKLMYRGYQENGFELTKQNEDKEHLILNYTGRMIDGYGEDERGERTFKLEYYFHKDVKGNPIAYERIRNKDYMVENKDILISPIKNYIVLWGEMFAGKEWTQSVSMQGVKYTAETKILEYTKDMYKLETTIEQFNGTKETYKEIRTYEVNKGLTEIVCVLGDETNIISSATLQN